MAGVDKMAPGSVMVLGNIGALCESRQAYDKRVAGVISGAADYKPGIVLDTRPSPGNRMCSTARVAGDISRRRARSRMP